VLRLVQPHIAGGRTARRGYAVACTVAAVGLVGLALAPEEIGGSVAILLTAGSLPLARSFGVIWVNTRTDGAVRATVHSLFTLAEYAGGILCGLAFAGFSDEVFVFVTSGALLVGVVLLVLGGTFRGSDGPAGRIH
jgi:hypothetical protein